MLPFCPFLSVSSTSSHCQLAPQLHVTSIAACLAANVMIQLIKLPTTRTYKVNSQKPKHHLSNTMILACIFLFCFIVIICLLLVQEDVCVPSCSVGPTALLENCQPQSCSNSYPVFIFRTNHAEYQYITIHNAMKTAYRKYI